jgi:hypothetical protein
MAWKPSLSALAKMGHQEENSGKEKSDWCERHRRSEPRLYHGFVELNSQCGSAGLQGAA